MEKISLNLDSSDFLGESIDKIITYDQYINFLITSSEEIVKRRFPNDYIRQKVRRHRNSRISMNCPICGDSMKTPWLQRGNIILEGKFKNHYKCFNCSAFLKIDRFFKDYKIDLKMDVINYIHQNVGDLSDSYIKQDISVLLDVPTIDEYSISRDLLKSRFNLVEVKGSPVWAWLNKRLQYKEKEFLYNPAKNYLVILNLTKKGDFLGFQKRNFGKGQTKYLTFNLPTIYTMLDIKKEIPPEIEALSQLFGIFSLDFTKQITLFEGPLDSFLFKKNSIANGGANKSFPLDIPIRYFYDKDKTGVKKALEKINEGSSVFLWEKFLKDINAPYRKKWDFTEVLLFIKNEKIPTPNLEFYFSDNPLDSIDI